jgi:hypothetical protein
VEVILKYQRIGNGHAWWCSLGIVAMCDFFSYSLKKVAGFKTTVAGRQLSVARGMKK